MPTPSSGYATPRESPGEPAELVTNGETQVMAVTDPPQVGADPKHQVESAEAAGKALGQAISDVLESLMAGIPAETVGDADVEGDDGGMDLDSPLTDLDPAVAGPGPSTAAFRFAKINGSSSGYMDAALLDVREPDCDDSLDLNGHVDTSPSDEHEEEEEELEQGEGEGQLHERDEDEEEDELDSEPEQLDEVLEDDQMLYDVLVHDLKECIDEAGWTFYLWKGVFIEEYGWDPEPLLDKYGALVEAAVPAFATKLDQEEPLPTTDNEHGMWTSKAFGLVLREIKAWDWEDPASTKRGFREVYKQKFGTDPIFILNKHKGLFKALVPAYAVRMKVNKAGGRRKRSAAHDTPSLGPVPSRIPSSSPKPDPPLHGPEFEALLRLHEPVLPAELPRLLAVALHMRTWDWDDPSTSYKDWWASFVSKHRRTPDDVLEHHRPLILDMVPAFGRRARSRHITSEPAHELSDAIPAPRRSLKDDPTQANGPGSPASDASIRQSLLSSEPVDDTEPEAADIINGVTVPSNVKENHRSVFVSVVRDLRKFDWLDPSASQDAWMSSFKQKYATNPGNVLNLYRGSINRLCPDYANRRNARPREVPDALGIRPSHRPMFDLILEDLKAQDFSDPHWTQGKWFADFQRRNMGSTTSASTILTNYGSIIKNMVPVYAERCALNRRHGSWPQRGSAPVELPGEPPRTPLHRRLAPHARSTHARSTTVAERQARARMLDAAAKQVSAAYREAFILLVDQMNDFDWTCDGDAMEKFRDHCKRRRINTTHLTRVVGHYGSLLRRCCPAFATRMREDRVTATPRGARRGLSQRAPSSENDFQILSNFPSRNSSLAPQRTLPEWERTPRPRPAPYVKPPRREGPLSFPSALAALDVELYRHQSSNSTVLPQLPSFSEYLSSERGKYDALVSRIRELDPAIEASLAELRAVAKDVDGLQAAVTEEWAVLQASSSGATTDTAMDVDAGPARMQAWEDKQAAAVARRNVLQGHRAELERMRGERARCLARVRAIDEVVVAARAKIEAALMDE